MRAYFEIFKPNGQPSNVNFYSALEGFLHMGFHVIHVSEASQIPVDDKECVVVGSINFMHSVFKSRAIKYAEDISYPLGLRKYLNRNIWESTINEIDSNANLWNVFVKPRWLLKSLLVELFNRQQT